MDYYNRTNPAQALACGYPAGMGEIPAQADGLGGDGTDAALISGLVALVIAGPAFAGYAASKHGYGPLGVVGAVVAAFFLEFVPVVQFAVLPVAAYYSFKD